MKWWSYTWSIYQDRLGTNIAKAQKTQTASLQARKQTELETASAESARREEAAVAEAAAAAAAVASLRAGDGSGELLRASKSGRRVSLRTQNGRFGLPIWIRDEFVPRQALDKRRESIQNESPLCLTLMLDFVFSQAMVALARAEKQLVRKTHCLNHSFFSFWAILLHSLTVFEPLALPNKHDQFAKPGSGQTWEILRETRRFLQGLPGSTEQATDWSWWGHRLSYSTNAILRLNVPDPENTIPSCQDRLRTKGGITFKLADYNSCI
jgi:hypothetical protein